MKRLFTFLIILTVGISSYAQKSTGNSPKTVAFADKTALDTQSFSIEKVYPNPVKDNITIDLRSAISGTIEVSLINIMGTEVKKWNEFSLNQGDQKVKLDLSEFKSGVYILKIIKQGQVKTQVLKKI
jgi:hypothetical protein